MKRFKTYVLIMIFSYFINVSVQMLMEYFIKIISLSYLLFQIAVATIISFCTKYYLDRKYIFNLEKEDFRREIGIFIIYVSSGIFSTIVFWIVEILFAFYSEQGRYKYIGAIIGLFIGTYLKYILDNRFIKNN